MAAALGNLNIPPLNEGERIASWERFFRASVAPLLAREDGQILAVGLLPAYVCRWRAERETVKDVVSEVEDLDTAFASLTKCLDPPVDPQQALHTTVS